MTPRSPRRAGPPKGTGLQFLVVLHNTDPLVWRRIAIPAESTFWGLHVAIQDAMGWLDCHLHEFRLLDPKSGTLLTLALPDPDGLLREDHALSVRDVPIWDFVQRSLVPFAYLYDFGDEWDHSVIFESLVDAEGLSLPTCLGGRSACPPEDCGGPFGYRRLVEALADRDHPEHEMWSEWIEGPIDPHDWDLDLVVFDDPEERWRKATQ